MIRAHHVSRTPGITALDWRGHWLRGLGRASHGAGTYLCTAQRALQHYRAQAGQGARVYSVRVDATGFLDCASPAGLSLPQGLARWADTLRAMAAPANAPRQFSEALQRSRGSVDGMVRVMLRELGAVECTNALLRAGVPGLFFRVGDGSSLAHPNIVCFDDGRLAIQGEGIE